VVDTGSIHLTLRVTFYVPEAGIEDSTADLLQARLWIGSGVPTTRPEFEANGDRTRLAERVGLRSSFENPHSVSSLDNR
jgi:hypothetical protein